MSFKSWSAAQNAKSKNKTAEKPETVSATSEAAKVNQKTKPIPSNASSETSQSAQPKKS